MLIRDQNCYFRSILSHCTSEHRLQHIFYCLCCTAALLGRLTGRVYFIKFTRRTSAVDTLLTWLLLSRIFGFEWDIRSPSKQLPCCHSDDCFGCTPCLHDFHQLTKHIASKEHISCCVSRPLWTAYTGLSPLNYNASSVAWTTLEARFSGACVCVLTFAFVRVFASRISVFEWI